MSFTREDLEKSEKTVGQILPVLLDKNGNIIDGFHRKRVNPNWKEERLDIDDALQVLRVRVAVQYRREVPAEEKKGWVKECRRLLRERGQNGTQEEIADCLGLSRQWVDKYDEEPDTYHKTNSNERLPQRSNLLNSNVWGLEDGKIAKGDPHQPDSQFHHGSTPAFVIENLIDYAKPQRVLDTMAGVGTTGYVCEKKGVEVDQFDVYPWPKAGVKEGDAENPPTTKTYDLIFNHIPYLNMVKYGDDEDDLSNFKFDEFLAKMERIFKKNFELLEDDGVYSVLVGDWRHGGQIIPITAHITLLGLKAGFILWDVAIKLSAEQKGKQLQEYRAQKHGYLPQNYDTVLIFKKGGQPNA